MYVKHTYVRHMYAFAAMNQQSQSKRERLRPQSRRSRRAKTTAKKQINLSCNKVTEYSLKDRKSYHSRRNSRIKKFVKIGAADVKKRKISADRSSKPVTIDSDDETTFYTFPSSSNRTTAWNNRYKIHKRREQRPSISNSRLSRRKPGPKVRDQYQTKGKQPLQELRVPVLSPLIESLSLTHPRLASAKNLNGRPGNSRKFLIKSTMYNHGLLYNIVILALVSVFQSTGSMCISRFYIAI